jgi:subfamily B ATP-binding cassette protein MsbA
VSQGDGSLERLTRGPLARLVRVNTAILLRFGLGMIAGALLPMLSIVLLHQFLAGVLGAEEGLASTLSRSIGRQATLWSVALFLLATFLATAAVGFYNAVGRDRLVRTIELRVMERLVRHLMTLSVLAIDGHSPGDILEAVRQDVGRLRATLVASANVILRGLTAIGLVISAIWLSPGLALISFPLLLLAAVPIVTIARSVRRRAYGFRRRAYAAFDVVLQMLRGIRVIKVYGGEDAEAARAVHHLRRHFGELMEITRSQAMGRVAIDSLGGLSVVVIVIVGGFQVLDGTLTWPSLLAFLLAIRATQGPLYDLNSSVVEIQRNVASLDRLDQLLSQQPSPRDEPDALPFEGPVYHLGFDRVSFSYDTGDRVLDDLSFDVSRGEVLGIVGPTGAGKTTLLGLAARFFDPSSGTVCVNGMDAKTLKLADLYQQVAVVTQDPFLFSASVRENIRCGRPKATDAEVEDAARAAEVHDEILMLPRGYDTLVGAGQRGLSGGQIQRLNIARAILKNAPLLLLDEATSSLDSLTEMRVQRALDRLMQGRTTMVVAHRLSTLRNATRLLVLDRGHIVAFGPHDELLARSPFYRRMWNAQMRETARRQRSIEAHVTEMPA